MREAYAIYAGVNYPRMYPQDSYREGMLFRFKLLRTIVVMSNKLIIVQVNSSIVHFAIQLFDRSKLVEILSF